MIDTFIIGGYWGSRPEPLNQVVDKILNTFQKLAETDDQFLKWYEGGKSKREALKHKLILNDENIKRLCLEQVKKGELDDRGISKNGFLFGLWTGHNNNESSGISFNVGDVFK